MDTGPVLGLSEMRSPFLVDLLDAIRRQTKAGSRTGVLTIFPRNAMPRFELDDDMDDDDPDEDEDFDEDDEQSDDDEDEDEPGDDVDEGETWQVAPRLTPSLDLLDWRQFPKLS